MTYFASIVNGLLVGLLAGICILYVFQISNPYPSWILRTFEQPWIILFLFAVGIIMLSFNKEAAALLIILSIALFIDKFLFARKPFTPPASPHAAASHALPTSAIIDVSKVATRGAGPNMAEEHGITLLPLTNTPPGSVPPCAGKYMPLSEIHANERGLKDYKDQLLIKDQQFHHEIKPEFGLQYAFDAEDYATF